MVRGALVAFERWNGWHGHSVAISAAVADILGSGDRFDVGVFHTNNANGVKGYPELVSSRPIENERRV